MTSEIRPGIRRLLRLVTGRSARRDADEEIRLHLELRTAQLVREGMAPSEARAEAERRFGDVDEERRMSRAAATRQTRRVLAREWLATVVSDVRYALRTLRRDAGFTAFALAIMALGIGASATVFSLVNGVLLRPLPFRDPGRLIWIGNIADNGVDEWQIQVSHLVDLEARNRSLAGTAGYFAYYSIGDAMLTTGTESRRLTRVPVTCAFFPLLGITPRLGRAFTADECRQESAPTTMLTEKTWREQFAADPSIVGRPITINDRPVTVIGVLPASFDFAGVFTPGSSADLFTPYALSEQNDKSGNTLAVLARLKPTVSIDQARGDIVALGKQLTDEYPRRNTLRAQVMTLDEHVNGRIRPALMVLAIAVAAVMLIVALNLASLQFARMTARSREIAVRLALGGSRRRLIRQAVTETLVLAFGGAILGIVFALIATRFVTHLSVFDIPLLARVHLDTMSVALTVGVAVITGVIVGVLPALNAPADPNEALKQGARGAAGGSRQTRIRSSLVVTEIAAALVLLVSASLLVRSFVHVLDTKLGFAPAQVARLRIDPPARLKDLPTMTAYYDEVLRRVRALPGVAGASVNDMLPFTGDRSWGIPAEGHTYQRGQLPQGFTRFIAGDYFRTMGIPLVAGRDFSDGDTPDAPAVVIINESMARKLWPNEPALGRRVRQGKDFMTVIGVVGDARHTTLESPFTGEVYFPIRQQYVGGRVDLVVRSTLPLADIASEARTALSSVAKDASLGEWTSMQTIVDRVASPRRFIVTLLGAFAAFAVALSALGIYALISFGVDQRRREIGIRMALGASSANVRRSVLVGTLQLASIGLVLGIIGAMLVVPAMGGLLFGVTWKDPVSFAGAVAMILGATALAGLLPANRASRGDPSVALREG